MNGVQGVMQRDRRLKWGRRRTWWILKQRADLGAREKLQTKRIVKGIPEIRFMSREVECSPRKRRNKLERVKT